MISRHGTALLLSAALLATAAARQALADSGLTLDPTVLSADDDATATPGVLMTLLGKAGIDKPLNDAKINIYGWVEGGYTYNHRHGTFSSHIPILPGPFNHELGDHFMLNQFTIRFERTVDSKTFDVGGLVEVTYGSDAARMHATGLGYNGSDPTDDDSPVDDDAVNNLHPIWQFDIPQAYITVNVPVGNGLQLMIGKWNTLLGYETVDPRENAFYSHAYLFSAVPYTQTGVLASYQINDQWGAKLGFSRGWDIALEDNNGDAIDLTGQVSYKVNDQITALLNWSSGPENSGDSGHYRTAVDPILTWKVNDQLSFAGEALYIYDGGINGSPGDTHHYGDIWGVALYAGYKLNDYVTLNARVEGVHTNLSNFAGFSFGSQIAAEPQAGAPPLSPVQTTNIYEVTLGATITPVPKDAILKNLSFRPEIRYDFSEDHLFPANNGLWKDQLTFGADVIFQF